MLPTEQEILERIKEGSEEAFRTLFDAYYHRLFCVARQYVRDRFIAETIVSDLFFHLWETRRALDIQVSLTAYLVRSVRNYALNYLQKNFVGREVSLDGVRVDSPLLFLSTEYPLGRLIEEETREKLYAEIDRLPAETRRVFLLSRVEELKYEEIALRLGISVNTVKYHVKQALSILRTRLKYLLLTTLCSFLHFF